MRVLIGTKANTVLYELAAYRGRPARCKGKTACYPTGATSYVENGSRLFSIGCVI